MSAADTIWQLRDDLQRTNAVLMDVEHDESVAWDRVRKAEAENRRLRELVAVGLRCCDFKCDGCRFNKHNACYVGEFEDEARKLGVEVDK